MEENPQLSKKRVLPSCEGLGSPDVRDADALCAFAPCFSTLCIPHTSWDRKEKKENVLPLQGISPESCALLLPGLHCLQSR